MPNSTPIPAGPERRAVAAKVELRKAAEGSSSPGTIHGYAAVFNQDSVPISMGYGRQFIEVLKPGCFRSCMGDDVRCLPNHMDHMPLGRSTKGTLNFREDEHGLYYENDLPNNTHGHDVAESVRRGDIDGNSFQFEVPDGGDSWDFPPSGLPRRTVNRVSRLHDVGPATFPAYGGTEVSLRSFTAALARVEKEAEQRKAAEAEAEARAAKVVSDFLDLAKARQRLDEVFLTDAPFDLN